MPRTDLSEIPSGPELTCDICIIGSGPAGASIARELAQSPLDIILLESGGEQRQAHSDELNHIENVGWHRELEQWSIRNRTIGGSSHTWAGRCAPFDDIDYEKREWVPHSGWPIGSDQLRPYLKRSREYVGLGIGVDYTDDRLWSKAGVRQPLPELDTDRLEPFIWQYSKDRLNTFDIMRFGPNFLANLPSNIRLIFNATVTRLNLDPYGRFIPSITVTSYAGARHTIRARSYVLCAGGIENARLLLASNDVEACGVGNRKDLVGRFLMDHPRGVLGQFDPLKSTPILRRFGLYHIKFSSQSYRFRHGFRLSPKVQRQEQLLNCTAWLDEEVLPDDPWRMLNGMLRGSSRSPRDVYKLLANSDVLAKGAIDLAFRGRGLTRRLRALHLMGMTEQVPDPASRVTLSSQTDRLGVPISRIDWKINALEERSLRRLAEIAAQEIGKLGYGPPKLEEWVEQRQPFPSSFRDIGHPTGTTRMSDDPSEGVVDAQCQVHGVDGLYVVGSSSFPTAGHANPTQMVVALAIRAADTLRERHGVAGPSSRTNAERELVDG